MIILLPHNDIITQIQTLLSIDMKTKVVQHDNYHDDYHNDNHDYRDDYHDA